MATSFTVNKADLEFILKQIKIAEATSAGYTPAVAPVTILQAIMDAYGLSAADAALAPFGLRTVDGSFNSLVAGQSLYGAADTMFPRLTDPVYRNDADGDTMPLGPGAPTITNTNYDPTIPGSHSVADADPRIISNLIVDMSINNPAAISAFLNNPLSVAYYAEKYGYEPTAANHPDLTNEDLQTIPNQSPDIGLSPGFNAWMTFFGQFFDHGLDLVTKGGNGTVYVPLQADDPLIAGADGVAGTADDLPAHLRFMALTRATPKTVDGVTGQENTTTSFVDQNQTYTSHASHQVFLREYAKVDIDGPTGNGPVAVSTGRLLDGSDATGSVAGAIGNWAEVKAQAIEMLGLKLSDFDVHNVPLLATDQYGKFLAATNGYAQVTVQVQVFNASGVFVRTQGGPFLMSGQAGGLDLANLSNPSGLPTLTGAESGYSYKTVTVGTGHAFLNDIAHHAAPGFADPDHNPATPSIKQIADADIDANGNGVYDAGIDTLTDVNGDGTINTADFFAADYVTPGVATSGQNELTYDDEMLNAHFVTGDGRGNENIALTTVHSIFHAEHNRLIDVNKATIAAEALNDPAFVKSWLLNGATADMTNQNTWVWDGDRLFQAARFGTEMQYQHMVFEEFARRIQPMVDPFIFNTSPEVDPSIVAEFAHTVYRFGHSMLTGTVDRLDANLNPLDPLDPNSVQGQQTLLAVFLNPQAYIGSGATLEEINANIIRGLSRDVGNAMDEFIVTDVRSNLLGLPLDLAVLNIARGRETGIPSLNQTRTQLYNDTGLADLKPYESWADFAMNIKNAASVVNFIAAYGTHTSITSVITLADKRAAAEALVFGGPGAPADRLAFLNGTDAYAGGAVAGAAGTRGGLNLVDLWIGGLAEESPEFGGMLGTTFNYVFEFQMEHLQFGDRMYYLTRTQGLNFLNNLEPNSFSDIVMRNTELGDVYSTHLNGQLFVTPDHIIELDRGIAQEDYNGADPGKDPLWDGSNPVLEALQGPKVLRDYTGGTTTPDGHDVGGLLRVLGGEHYVLGGTEGNDRIYGDSGMDTLWGDGGDDYLNGGTEADDVFGGEGNDVIEDPFGEGDVLRGNQGHDVITSARGADLLFGDQGQDYIVLGQDAAEVFGGTETDFILGGMGKDFLLGNEGDDWIEGGGGFDTIAGENSELFFNSPIIGHDVAFGQGDEQDYDMESGDDIMGSGASVFRYEGMFGFDWAMGKGDFSTTGVKFDAAIPIFTTIPNDILKDRFDQVEGFSGWHYDDFLQGDDRGHKGGGSSAPDSVPTELFADHLLTQEGIDRITGLETWLGGPVVVNGSGVVTSSGARETLFGGASGVPGSTPVSTFRDGNIIMGGDGNDTVRGRGGFDLIDGDAYLNVRIKIVIPSGDPLNPNPNAGTYSAESMNTDTSVAGQYAGKVYFTNADGSPNFASVAFGGASLTSLLLDRTINPGQMSIVREILDGTVSYVSENFNTTISSGYTDDDATWTQNWTETGDGTPGTPNGGDIQIVNFDGSNKLRFNSTDNGDTITRAVNLAGKTTAILSFDWQEVNRDAGENVLVQAWNLTTNSWDTLRTMEGSASNGTGSVTVALTANQIGAGSQIRFQAVGTWANDDTFYIDNVAIGEHPTDTDTALFQGTRGEYDIEGITNTTDAGDSAITYTGTARDLNGDGFISVRDRDTGLVGATVWRIVDGEATEVALSSRGLLTDDHDLYKNVEVFQFADQQLVVGGNNQLASGTVTISDPTPFEGLVTPYVGQTLTATLSGLTDGNGVTLDANGRPTGLYFVWQTTEVGGNSGWSDITIGDSYTVRSVDPGHILRAVAKFKDAEGNPESIISVPTDNPTAVYSVNENSLNGTVVTNRIPFSPDYDSESINGAPPVDVDIATLHHEIDPAFSSGGRFTVISNGLDFAGYPQYAIVVAQGGPVMLNYEAPVHTPANQSYQFVDNQYQIVVNSYSDTPDNGGVLVARRQFTVILNDQGDVASIAPTLDLNAPLTTTTNGQYRDEFNTSALNNSNGTTAWGTSPWVETGDNGNINSATAGQITIDNGSNVMRFGDNDTDPVVPVTNPLGLGTAQIQRTVNLAGVTSASVSYAYTENNFDAGETVTVTFSDDGTFSAGHIQTIQTITSATANSGNITNLALTGTFTANAAIRFVVSGTNANSATDAVTINDLTINTVTTTSVPGTPGNDYATTFTEGMGSANGAPVAIALNPAVADGNGPPIMGATVKLTNAQALDALTIQGTLPAGITSSPVDSSVPGVLTLYLAGPASFAAMQTAIGQVRFSNTSQNPDTTARVINVTVNDGEVESTIATATVTVVPTNDAPDAVNDVVITNAANGVNFTIPEWALLANDTDVDSLALDVTAVGGASNLTGLTLNVGSVTMARTATGNASFTYTAGDGAATDVATASVAQSLASTTLSETFGSTSYTTDDGAWTQDWSETGDDGNSTAANGQIRIDGNELVFDAGNTAAASDGASIQRTVNLTGATSANLSFDYDENNFDSGETVLVQFSDDGTFSAGHIQLVQTINSASNEGSSNIALTGAFGANSAIRFVVSGTNIDGDNVQIDNINVTYTTPSNNIVAGTGNQILVGDGNGSTFDGGAGNDIVLAGAGNDTVLSSLGDDTVDGGAGDDTIHWTAPAAGTLHGWDVVNGGTEGAAGDTFTVTGNSTAETFRIYTAVAWLALDPLNVLKNPNSEIVITRTNTSSGTVVVAELDEIEEIHIQGTQVTSPGGAGGGPLAGGDSFEVIGNFSGTDLNFSTITIDGDVGDDTIDISSLQSAHRIVFRSNGGNDTIIGNLRPQDVIDLPAGATAADYTTTTDDDGVSTMTDGTHSITFTAPGGLPQVGNDDDEEDENENEENENDDTDDDDETTSPAAGAARNGTPQSDILNGTSSDDNLVALAGDDVVTGNAGADAISAGEGADFVSGGDGRDIIFAGAGDDQVFGGGQADVIYGDAGADRIFGDGGNDMITAGAGDDSVFGGDGDDLIVAEVGDGNDVYFGDAADGGVGKDTLDISAATVSVTVNLGSGALANGSASSTQTGNDTLWGIENVNTGSGNDTITASNAVNVINGGAGSDTFKFLSASGANGDTIVGFEPGDRIDLSAIDADLSTTGDQSFTLVTGAAATAAGQLAVTFGTGANGNFTLVQGNIDGGATDFTIQIEGHHTLTNANLTS